MNYLGDNEGTAKEAVELLQETLMLLEGYFPELAFIMLVGVVVLFGYVILKLSETKK